MVLVARLAATLLVGPHREHNAATVVIPCLAHLLPSAVAVVVLENRPEMLVGLVVVVEPEHLAAVGHKDQPVEPDFTVVVTGVVAVVVATVLLVVTPMVAFPMVVPVATATPHLSAVHQPSMPVAVVHSKVDQVEPVAVVRVLVPCLVQAHLVPIIAAVVAAVRMAAQVR